MDGGLDAGLFVVGGYEHRHRGVDLPQPGRAGAWAGEAPDMGAGEEDQRQQPQQAQRSRHDQHPGHDVRERTSGRHGPVQDLALPPFGGGHPGVGGRHADRVRHGGEPVGARVVEQLLRLVVRQFRLAELADQTPRRITRRTVGGDQHIAVGGGLPGGLPLGAAQRVHLGGQRHPQQAGADARRARERLPGEAELHPEAHARRGAEVGSRVGVRADLVTLVEDPPDQVRMACRLGAEHEEGGVRVVLAQQIQQPGGPLGIGSAVEGEGDGARWCRGGRHLVPVDTAQDRAALVHGPGHGAGARAACLRGVHLVDGPALEEQGDEDDGQGQGEQPPVSAGVTGTGVPTLCRAAHAAVPGMALITAASGPVVRPRLPPCASPGAGPSASSEGTGLTVRATVSATRHTLSTCWSAPSRPDGRGHVFLRFVCGASSCMGGECSHSQSCECAGNKLSNWLWRWV